MTVTAGQTWIIKEILHGQSGASASFQYCIYVLPSGNTDLTTVAGDQTCIVRMGVENKSVFPLMDSTTSAAATALTVLARNTVVSAGDVIKIWVNYGAVTPADCRFVVSVSYDDGT